MAKKLKDVGVGYVQVSIDGLKDVHEQIRGPKTFDKAISAIKNCLNEGLYTCIGTTITKQNVHQIYELTDLAKSLKVQKFEIVDFVPSGVVDGVSGGGVGVGVPGDCGVAGGVRRRRASERSRR